MVNPILKMYGKEEDDDDDGIKMERKEFISEHKKLIKILRSGSKHDQLMEANEQERELKECEHE